MMLVQALGAAKCHSVLCSVWDYAAKTPIARRDFAGLDHLQEFMPLQLKTLAAESFKLIKFERDPYQRHLYVLKSVLK